MALKSYIQVGTEESFYIYEADSFAVFISQYGCDVLVKKGKLYINNDLTFIDIGTCLIDMTGAIYLPVNKPPIEPRYLLLEDGDFILLEDESKILLQR